MTTTPARPWHTLTCPPWCVEHYTGEDGTRNHSGDLTRGVVGESASNGEPMELHVWPELRVTPDGHTYPVGIVNVSRNQHDMELTAEQLRRLAAHCTAVAALCDQANGKGF